MKSIIKKAARILPDKVYISLLYRMRLGKWPNLKNPKSYNEKLQWIKLYDRRPEYSIMVDKYEVKKYIAERIGEEYVIPTLGIWNHFDEIDFNKLPDQFVLKCTHDSGGLVICKDKSKLDLDVARKKIESSLKDNYFWNSREWPYKSVKPRIIAEKYMVDESGVELKDYKLFAFDGEPKYIEVDFDRYLGGHKRNLYTLDWEYMNVRNKHPNAPDVKIEKPECLTELIALSKKLSEGIPHVRTDFYVINGKIYFGELTFFHGSGMQKFEPESFEIEMGDWLILPEKM